MHHVGLGLMGKSLFKQEHACINTKSESKQCVHLHDRLERASRMMLLERNRRGIVKMLAIRCMLDVPFSKKSIERDVDLFEYLQQSNIGSRR